MFKVYGISTCSTVKKALAWLEANGHQAEFVDYRKTPIDAAQIKRWVEQVGSKPLRNTSGKSYRALPADKKEWPDDRWVASFADDLMLLKRPVIEVGQTVKLVGFRGTDEQLTAALTK